MPGHCMAVRFGRGTPFVGLPLTCKLDAHRLGSAPGRFIVRVVEDLVHVHHVPLLCCLDAESCRL